MELEFSSNKLALCGKCAYPSHRLQTHFWSRPGMTPPHGPSNLASRSILHHLLTAELFLSGFEIMTITLEMKISLLVLSFQMIVLHENKTIQEASVIFLFYVFF